MEFGPNPTLSSQVASNESLIRSVQFPPPIPFPNLDLTQSHSARLAGRNRSAKPVCGSPAIVVGQRRGPVLLGRPRADRDLRGGGAASAVGCNRAAGRDVRLYAAISRPGRCCRRCCGAARARSGRGRATKVAKRRRLHRPRGPRWSVCTDSSGRRRRVWLDQPLAHTGFAERLRLGGWAAGPAADGRDTGREVVACRALTNAARPIAADLCEPPSFLARTTNLGSDKEGRFRIGSFHAQSGLVRPRDVRSSMAAFPMRSPEPASRRTILSARSACWPMKRYGRC